jgi:hypothetical protein
LLVATSRPLGASSPYSPTVLECNFSEVSIAPALLPRVGKRWRDRFTTRRWAPRPMPRHPGRGKVRVATSDRGSARFPPPTGQPGPSHQPGRGPFTSPEGFPGLFTWAIIEGSGPRRYIFLLLYTPEISSARPSLVPIAPVRHTASAAPGRSITRRLALRTSPGPLGTSRRA